MAKILLQSILITIWLNSCVRSMEWAELPKVSNQVKVASSSSMSKNNPIAHELEESDHFSTDSSTRSLILKDKYFGDELRKIQKEIQDLSFIGHGYLKIKLNRIQNLIGRILKVPGEHNYGENSSLDSKKNPDNIRDEILAEVREVLFEFDNLPNEPWDAGLSEKWAIMSGILRVLDPFIKHGFFSTEQTQLWFKDLKILQVSAYVLSNELYLSLRYWLPSIESLSKLSRKEFVWLSTLKGQEVKFFLRQLIGFSYTNASSKISYPRLLPVVNLFLENSEVTENTFTTLAEVADSPEKFHKSSKYEIELISCFVNQALTYFQLYAPTEVVNFYSDPKFNIIWKKKELLDNICQLIPISKNYNILVEKFLGNIYNNRFTGKDQIHGLENDHENAGLKNILKALEEEEGRIKTGNEKLSEETLKKFSIVDRVSLKRAFKFKAKVRQLSNFVNLIPAVYSKDICEWLQLPKQEKLLDSIRSRALFLNKEIEILANLKNQLRGKE